MSRETVVTVDADRGRVPFALVGVVLLVGSATLATTIGQQPLSVEPRVDDAMERTTAATRTALTTAASIAGRNAALTPVVERANTSVGRILNESHTFRDALRVRVYVRTRSLLRTVGSRYGPVTTTASLPPTPNATALARAKRRVNVSRAGPDGTRLRVEIGKVTVTARRNGRVVGRERFTPTVVVATPTLALHDRVASFERRANRGVFRPGLGQSLTGTLYPLAWARGYAQYRGAPIENVVANRHVGLATNLGLLAEQRRAFGRTDPEGRAALAVGAARVATLAPQVDTYGVPTERLLDPNREPPDSLPSLHPGGSKPGPDDELAVSPVETVDAAFRATVDESNLTSVLRGAYSSNVTVRARLVGDRSRPPEPPAPDGDGWRRVDTTTNTTATVVGSTGLRPPDAGGRHVLATYRRTVRRRHERVAVWRQGSATRRTRTVATDTVAVAVVVLGDHAAAAPGPDRTIESVHRSGRGPFGGPNLADVPEKARQRVVEVRGGVDALVRRAATGRLDSEPTLVAGERPENLRKWAYADLVALRKRLRNLTVTVPRGEVGTFEANPAARLATAVRQHRATLVDAPSTYGTVAERARVALRAAYIDRVLTRLDARADRRNRTRRRLRKGMAGGPNGNLSTAQTAMNRRSRADRAEPSADAAGGPTRLSLAVETAPNYLTLSAVDHDSVSAVPDGSRVHPLAARNVNVPAVPYGDATDAVLAGLFGSASRTDLGTAARSLRAANRTLAHSENSRLRRRRDRLRDAVARSNAAIKTRLQAVLARHDVAEGHDARRRIVEEALARWPTTADRALALRNGSVTPAVLDVVERVDSRSTRVARDRLRSDLEGARTRALAQAVGRPRQGAVERASDTTRAVATTLLKEAAARGAQRGVDAATNRLFNETLGEMPAGFPVLPWPTHWRATVGYWHVTVRGRYERFAVRARRGPPDAAGGGVTYVRDGTVARLDVDGDGTAERLGRASRVSFETSTSIVVVVPAGKTGVGERDGNADERSAGWPEPGPVD